jgi:L-ascorbate metabolism protein UlaG (beta-lactamase superfamily)
MDKKTGVRITWLGNAGFRMESPAGKPLLIGDRFTMGRKEAALACRLLRARCVIPMHHGTDPALTGRPEHLRELTRDISGMEIIALKPGETWSS